MEFFGSINLCLQGRLVEFSTKTFNSQLGFLTEVIIRKFDSAERLTTKINELLQAEAKIFEERAGGIPDSLWTFDNTKHCPDEINEFGDIFEAFPIIQRRSELISICSIFENGLKEISKVCEEFSTLKIDKSTIKSEGNIDKLKKHIESYKEIDISKNAYWNEILLIQQIRNKFVHHDGFVKSANLDLTQYIKGSTLITLNRESKIIVNNGFTEYCIKIYMNFFIQLFNLLAGK